MTKVKLALLVLHVLWLFALSEASYGARHTAIIIDADNGNILHEIDATQSWYPASLTKLMTLYMTFDALRSGRISLYDSLTASTHASQQPNSKLGLRRGEHLTVEDAILAIITRSANDASVVLAEHLGNTEANFAANMTAKAHALGMYNSQFMNATGLPNNQQVTTSRDMAVLALKTRHHFPEYYHYFAAHSFNYKGTELRGINKFTANYPGAEGMKTGFTCASGFNLIGAAQQNGRHLIGVVMGGMTSQERYQLMMQKMDASFALANDNPTRNINTMAIRSTGLPPQQLDCGRGAVAHPALISMYGKSNKAMRKHVHGIKNNKSKHRSANSKSTKKTVSKTKTSHKKPAKSTNYHKPKTVTKTSKKTNTTHKKAR